MKDFGADRDVQIKDLRPEEDNENAKWLLVASMRRNKTWQMVGKEQKGAFECTDKQRDLVHRKKQIKD